MASTGDGTGMLPGFDFLQGLFKTAGAGLPAAGQWVAPTLDPAELDKRIQDLKTVQFWLEQNARVLAATIQALEVQRMTLNTLHNLNLPLSELTEALKIKLPATPPPAAEPPAPPTAPARTLFSSPWAAAAPAAAPSPAPAASAPAAAAAPEPAPVAPAGSPSLAEAAAAARPAVDPMQWWGALTQQFTELAAKAVKDGSDALASAAPLATAGAGAAAPAASTGSSTKTAAVGKAGAAAGPRTAAPTLAKPAAGTSGKASAKASAKTSTRTAGKAAARSKAVAAGKPRRAG